jgi:hypothetical protein
MAVDLPVQGRLIHLRIVPPRNGNGLDVQFIDLRDRDGKATIWRFDTLE